MSKSLPTSGAYLATARLAALIRAEACVNDPPQSMEPFGLRAQPASAKGAAARRSGDRREVFLRAGHPRRRAAEDIVEARRAGRRLDERERQRAHKSKLFHSDLLWQGMARER